MKKTIILTIVAFIQIISIIIALELSKVSEYKVFKIDNEEFYLKRTETTQQEWINVMGSNPSFFKSCGGLCPVDNVNIYDVVHYLNKLSQKEQLDPCYQVQKCIQKKCETKGAYYCEGGLYCEEVRFNSSCDGYRLINKKEWDFLLKNLTTIDESIKLK
jgi:hypothetical protein